jgi:hypothetical protein
MNKQLYNCIPRYIEQYENYKKDFTVMKYGGKKRKTRRRMLHRL